MTNKELEKRMLDFEETVKALRQDVRYLINKTKDNEVSQNHGFKVGDRVQFKKYNGEIVVGTIRDICMDKATIEQKTEDGVGVYIMGEVHLGRLKPATDEPKCKFKVGDKVIYCPLNYFATITKIVENKNGVVYDIDFFDGLGSAICGEWKIKPYAEPRWTFTDDEKVILRNLADEFEWVARDKDGSLFIFGEKPRKASDYWDADFNVESLIGFNHLFQSIKWEDEEPCEFRKYL